jgi:hypothetical protein
MLGDIWYDDISILPTRATASVYFRYTECRLCCVIMLNVIILSVFHAECRTFLILFLVSLCKALCIFIVILCFIMLSVAHFEYFSNIT